MIRCFAAALLLVGATSALAAPPAGNWKLRIMLNRQPSTVLFAMSESEGKWVCDVLDTRPPLPVEPKMVDVAVTGDTVKFRLTLGKQDLLTFDGVIAKDAKRMNGSIAQANGELGLAELLPSKLKKLDDPFEMNREMFDQVEPTATELFEIGFELLPQAGAKKLTPDEVRSIVDRMGKAAATYGPRWDRTVALRAANALVDQAPFADIALAQARRAERMLNDADAASDRIDVLETLSLALTKTNKADEAKPLAVQIARLEARDYGDYIKASPLGEVADAGPRKAKSDRVVLVELFTGAEFSASAAVEQSAAGVLKAFKPTDVMVLNYHFHFPDPASSGDPLTAPETTERLAPLAEQIQRGAFLFVDGKPGPRLTRQSTAKELFAELQKAVSDQREKPAGCKIALSLAKGKDGLDAKASVTDLDVGSNKMALRFAVVEPRVRYVGGNGVRYHQHVVRALPGGGKGFPIAKAPHDQAVSISVDAIKAGQLKYLADFARNEGDFPRSAKPMLYRNLKLIAFVQNDSTGDVLGTAAIDLDVK